MAEDDGFFLNITSEPPPVPKAENKRATRWAERKELKKQRQRQWQQGRLHGDDSKKSHAGDAALKGYSLDVSGEAENGAENPGTSEHHEDRGSHEPSSEHPIGRPSATSTAPPTRELSPEPAVDNGPLDKEANVLPKRTSAEEEVRPHSAGKIHRSSRAETEREATPDDDEMIAPDDDEEGGGAVLLGSLVASVASKDAAVEEELAQSRSHRQVDDDQEDDLLSSSDDELYTNLKQAARLEEGKQQRRKGRERARHVSREAAAGAALRPGELARAAKPTKLGKKKGRNDALTDPDEEPSSGFEGLDLVPSMVSQLEYLGFKEPSPVQRASIPILAAHKDVLVKAPTGSGKTLAYLAPLVSELARLPERPSRAQGTLALVICPTRELALQVQNVVSGLLQHFFWLVGGSINGGESREREKARLRKGIHILAATPGRLLDHLRNTASFNTSHLSWLILDEADRLLDLGFEQKVHEILDILNERQAVASSDRVTGLFSATLSPGVERLAGLSLRDPVSVGLDSIDSGSSDMKKDLKDDEAADMKDAQENEEEHEPDRTRSATTRTTKLEFPPRLRQYFLEVPCKLRFVLLASLLKTRLAGPSSRVLVFLSTRDSVEFYHALLHGAWQEALGDDSDDEVDVASFDDEDSDSDEPSSTSPATQHILKLHGDMDQASRTKTFAAFMRSKRGILLCTDVAARGLDFPGVTAVVQLDPASSIDEYAHRVGRAARAGAAGESLLLLGPNERGYVGLLEERGTTLRELPATRVLDEALGYDRRAGKHEKDDSGRVGLSLERHQGAYALQKRLMAVVARSKTLTNLAGAAFRSWVRAYAGYPTALKGVFHIRKLHLGHVAHSFALAERPSLVSTQNKKPEKKKKMPTTKRSRLDFDAGESKSAHAPAATKKRRKGVYTLG